MSIGPKGIGPKGIGPKGFKAVIALSVLLTAVVFTYQFFKSASVSDKTIKVLSYSSFLASWGPGPDLAKLFKNKTGIEVVYQDADDAGLLLTKLALFPSDVVLGFDAITAADAKQRFKWKDEFVMFDWAPLTFIYRQGETSPPKNLDDLLDPRFKGQVSLQDPRTSAPGLQFLFWLVAIKGEDQAFEYLDKLRPSIRAISPSWSTAYGLFQKGEASLAFSYLTSPVYHWIHEKDRRYQPVIMAEKLIYQTELAGIPDGCRNCDGAAAFVKFLVSPEAQKIIMQKNVMLPTESSLMAGTEFETLPRPELIDSKEIERLVTKKAGLLQRWKDLKL